MTARRSDPAAAGGPPGPAGRLRVMIAEDEPTVRSALASFLGGEDTIDLVASASDAEEAVELARRHRPDIALVDVRMPRGGGPVAARGILAASPQTRVVALSAYDDRESVLAMLRSGASGYLVKGTPAATILEAIFATAQGQASLSNEIAGDVVRELSAQFRREESHSEERRRRFDRVAQLIAGAPVPMAFQSVVDLRDGTIVGVEALARFDPLGERPPDVWLTEAGQIGLREELELAAVRAGLQEVDRLPPGAFLSLNVSPSVAVLPMFARTITETAASRTVIEVTEHAPVEDYEELNRMLRAARGHGVRLAVDDAGAGFASLRHIVRLAPDFIKLDMTLTRDIDRDPARRALAIALISFAREIGATMIAEGIETEAEFRTLRSLGISLGQGFFLGMPGGLPIERPVLPD